MLPIFAGMLRSVSTVTGSKFALNKKLCRNGGDRRVVILNGVKNLIITTESIIEILRLPPQNDIATQSLNGALQFLPYSKVLSLWLFALSFRFLFSRRGLRLLAFGLGKGQEIEAVKDGVSP